MDKDAVYVVQSQGHCVAVTSNYDAAQQIAEYASHIVMAEIFPFEVVDSFDEWSERVYDSVLDREREDNVE